MTTSKPHYMKLNLDQAKELVRKHYARTINTCDYKTLKALARTLVGHVISKTKPDDLRRWAYTLIVKKGD